MSWWKLGILYFQFLLVLALRQEAKMHKIFLKLDSLLHPHIPCKKTHTHISFVVPVINLMFY